MEITFDDVVEYDGDMDAVIAAVERNIRKVMKEYGLEEDDVLDIREEEVPTYSWREVYLSMGAQ